MKPQRLDSLSPSHDEIRSSLEHVLASPDFKGTPQQVALLKYVVAQSLAGNSDRIKGYTVATEVFGRREDFDQNIDPIVSIQAARLRLALDHYYQAGGRHDTLRIDIPKGTYVPVFEKQPHAPLPDTQITRAIDRVKGASAWPSVVVHPLCNLSGDPDLDSWGLGLVTELVDELNHYPNIRVLICGAGNPETEDDDCRARFALNGWIRSDGTCIKLNLRLTDTLTARQIWCHAYRFGAEGTRTIALQENIARQVAVNVAGKRGWIAKVWERGSENRLPQYAQTYETVLLYDRYKATSTPEAFQRAMTAAEKTVARDPDCGQAWTIRAALFADIYALDIPGYERPLEKAFEFAQMALRILPHDQRAHTIMAFVHLLRSDLPAGLAKAEQALDLGPETLFALDGIGYLMTLLGDWERGPGLIEKVIRLNPFYGNYVHYALWVNCLRQQQYDQARQETMKLTRSAHFWDHLAKAATCGLCGRIEEGRRCAAELLERKPNFPKRGRMLIGHFIKFDDITDRIIQGLEAVGVRVLGSRF